MYPSEVPAPTLVFSKEDYEEGMKIDVTPHAEKQGRITYINIHYAQMMFKQHFPDIVLIVLLNPETNTPLFDIDQGRRGTYFNIVFKRGDDYSQIFSFPAMRRPGKGEKVISPALEKGDAREIHDSLMRAMVRAMAELTGMGKGIWLDLDQADVQQLLDPAIQEEPPRRSTRRPPVVEADYDDGDEEEYDDEEEYEEGDEEEDPVSPPPRTTSRQRSSRTTRTTGKSSARTTSRSMPARNRNR